MTGAEIELAPAASITTLRSPRPRQGSVNCITIDPYGNVQHLAVKQLAAGLVLAICGFTFDITDHNTDTETCSCAPLEQWARCERCVAAKQASDERAAARGRQ